MKTMQLLEAMTGIDGSLIETAQPEQKKTGKPVIKILLLAALIAALTMTAFASEEIATWFKDYFSRYQELSQNQITFIEDNTTDISQSQTYHGYTIAVESAISDGSKAFIKLKLTAPEHVVLDAKGYSPENYEFISSIETGDLDRSSWSVGFGKVEDRDGLQNTIDLLIEIHGWVDDRTQWKLHIENIKGYYYENPGTDEFRDWYETVAIGTWDFDITFTQAGNQEIELITEPVPGRVNIALNKELYRDVFITSLRLRAMSAEIRYEYVDIEPEFQQAAGEFEDIYVVMKDGSRVWMLPSTGYPGGLILDFLSPIILEDVDHVLLPDGTKLSIS